MKHLTWALGAVCLLMACYPPQPTTSNTPTAKTEELVFGTFYGRCRGSEECIELFKLTDGQLYEDRKDAYPNGDNPSFEFEALDQTAYNKAKGLMAQFPNALLEEQEATLGCPDCADQGGYFIGYKNEGQFTYWRVDKNLSNVPAYLHRFLKEVEETIQAFSSERH